MSDGDLARLLDLQTRDTAIDQLLYRREHLDGHEQLASVQRQAAVLRPLLADATSKRDGVAARQATLEAEIDSIERRIAEINDRLYGTVAVSPKDAQAMSEEVSHLKARLSDLEDNELEAMEEAEPLQMEVTRLEGEARAMAISMQEAQSQIAVGQSEIDSQLAILRNERDASAAGFPEPLLKKYDALRKSLGGVAVAPLVNGSCGGCHLTLSASELARLNKAGADEVVNCEECGRILVRP